MKELPIIFRGPMVRAILEGRKTQTRRIIARLSGFGCVTEFCKSSTSGYDWQFRDRRWLWNDISDSKLMERCPYGQPGDRLWVKETWAQEHKYPNAVYKNRKIMVPIYRADKKDHVAKIMKWKSPIYMPRWASRITLEVVSVRVERLQGISASEAQAEGIYYNADGVWHWSDRSFVGGKTPIEAYRLLWESINGSGSWDKNPWVWVVEFKRVEDKTA